MQQRRQQSILSFLQKPPPDSGQARRTPAVSEAFSTDTPPEKPPRPRIPVAGIMQKFARPEGRNREDVCETRCVEERGPKGSSLGSSTDEYVSASTLFPELDSSQTPLHEHQKKSSSWSSNDECVRAPALFKELDSIQTPLQKPSKKTCSGPSGGEYVGATTLFAEHNLQQAPLQNPSKELSSGPSNGEYVRATVLFAQTDPNGAPLQEPLKKFNSRTTEDKYNKATGHSAELDSNGTPLQQHPKKFCSGSSNGEYFRATKLFAEINSDPLEPETPAVQPTVPRLKRVHDDCTKIENARWSLLCGSNKKVKLAHNSPSEKKAGHGVAEGARSKFEWLNPAYIRDADGRRPNDPLYDKRTVFIPPAALSKMSASQKQYWTTKCEYMDAVLFFKVGKFYELYEEDAEIGHKELDWKMTISGVGKCRQVGISESGINEAIEKLVARGYNVGRVEQLETAGEAKARGSSSVIERKLVHVSTPATAVDGNIGVDSIHLLALKEGTQAFNGSRVHGFAFLDYAALKIWVGSFCDDDSSAALGALLVQVSPREMIYESSGLSKDTHTALRKYASSGSAKMQLTPLTSTDFSDASQIRKSVHSKGYFKASADTWLSALDYSVDHDLVVCALGGLIGHLRRLMLEDALKNGEVLPYKVYRSCLRMDGQTLVNLEIFNNNFDGGLSGTLYKHLNHCITASGKRLLRRWLCHPLKDISDINKRLDIVEGFIQNCGLGSVTLEHLRRIPDLERLLGRVRSTVGLSSIIQLPSIGEKVLKQRIKTFGTLVKGLRFGIDLLNILQREDHGVPALSKVVNIPTLSSLDELIHQFEITIDDDFPRYQDHDVKDSDADTLAILVELFVGRAAEWSQVIDVLSTIDVLRSFAATALSSYGTMSRPCILRKDSEPGISHQGNGPILRMKSLWHPYAVAEGANGLVPNDVSLGRDQTGHNRCALLLTGPNMGGKSTLMRATCLAVILAQLGCYVPCESCELTPADTIFTRLGATDRILSGESTFLVECTEAASVLQNATEDSLVLLDELGRGTSTFDGYAIAYAVFRHLVERVHCRLLFATHYHPLTREFATHPLVSLQHMACMFKPRSGSHGVDGDEELTFLYRLTAGACPESYGLQVAQMAGLPKSIIKKASVASQKMKSKISNNFQSSERRADFSTLHEEWLRTILAIASMKDGHLDEDASDTLFCVWHELRSHHRK